MTDAEFDLCRAAWRSYLRDRPVLDLEQRVTPFATIGDLTGAAQEPSAWRPFARRRWFRRLEARVLRELAAQRSFALQISTGLR